MGKLKSFKCLEAILNFECKKKKLYIYICIILIIFIKEYFIHKKHLQNIYDNKKNNRIDDRNQSYT